MSTTFDREKEMERRSLKRSHECRHFNGLSNGRCEAGVAYASVRITADSARASYPCIDHVPSPHPRCDQCVKPTLAEARAQIDAEEVEHQAIFAAMRAAHAHAKYARLGRGRGGTGEMPCPKCVTGTLRYIVSSFNGHMHGQCSTPKCLSWME